MSVLWLGINDDPGCVLQFHELRRELESTHGVTLAGPGYDRPYGEKFRLSSLDPARYEWVVLDDCNALGYVPIIWDAKPDRVAWRENDWHNRNRQATGLLIDPEVVFGCVDRPAGDDPFRERKGWTLCPMPVNIHRFHPGDGQDRPYTVGIYGKTGRCYELRSRAWRALADPDCWRPKHGGYWRDGRGSVEGKTFYNDELAEALRKVLCLWVDGSDWNVFLQKYNEGAASGCVLIGEKPFNFGAYYPDHVLMEVAPEDALQAARDIEVSPFTRKDMTIEARDHCVKHHSIQARARQIMEVLHAA